MCNVRDLHRNHINQTDIPDLPAYPDQPAHEGPGLPFQQKIFHTSLGNHIVLFRFYNASSETLRQLF